MTLKNINNEKMRVIAYSISEEVEREVQIILKKILNEYKCIELLAPIYTSVKELMINAIKANFKNIYFEDYSAENASANTVDYELALKLFKLEMSREHARYLEGIARQDDIKATVEFWTDDEHLHVSVTNPVRMTELELKNINKKLEDAEECEDVAEYFLKNENDPNREGAGLGLVLIMMMLKSLSAPDDSLVISSADNMTQAYLRIPLRSDDQVCA